MTRIRRKYVMPDVRGPRCEDCGQHRPYTVIYWWASGGAYRVCGSCINAYRGVILAPCRPGCAHS
jgi:hypothetical protein